MPTLSQQAVKQHLWTKFSAFVWNHFQFVIWIWNCKWIGSVDLTWFLGTMICKTCTQDSIQNPFNIELAIFICTFVAYWAILNDKKDKICKKKVLNFTVYDVVESENESKKENLPNRWEIIELF